MFDLTVLLLAPDMDPQALGRSLHALVGAANDGNARIEVLVIEALRPGTDVALTRAQPIAPLPAVMRRALRRNNVGYLLQYGSTETAALRRAVRSARGHHVCLLREGDELGFRRLAQGVLRPDRDITVAVPGTSGQALAAHGELASAAPEARGIAALAAVSALYDGALIFRRDFLADLLGEFPEPGPMAYAAMLNERAVRMLCRRSGRVGFTEALAVFPSAANATAHLRHVVGHGLPALAARVDAGGSEPATSRLLGRILQRWAARFGQGPTIAASATSGDPARCLDGELTAHADQVLRWARRQVVRIWGVDPTPQHGGGRTDMPRRPTAPAEVRVSLISSAFRGQSLVHGFLANLVRQRDAGAHEVVVVSPEPNVVQDLVVGHFSGAFGAVRLLALDSDPGIYGCWNIGLREARGRYASNANLDDRRDLTQVATLADVLDATGADVASAGVAITESLDAIRQFDGDLSRTPREAGKVWFCEGPEPQREPVLRDFFVLDATGELRQCWNFPHCMPVWRRSLHQRFGDFDEPRHGTYADFAFWLKVAAGGGRFVHLSRPLGLYLIDPGSHNRRNADQDTWDALVSEHLPAGARLPARAAAPAEPAAMPAPSRTPAEVRLDFGGQLGHAYGRHRSGWSFAMQAFDAFHDAGAEVYCDTFIEKRFVWGNNAGEGGAGPVAPLERPWVGFVHVPPNVPSWFQHEQSNGSIFATVAWQRSLKHCRGLFTLTDYHRRALMETLDPDFPISALLHPTEFPQERFDFERFLANPHKRLVQVGWWLRKLTAIGRVDAGGLSPTLLVSEDWTKNLLLHAERRYHGLLAPSHVETLDFLPNDAYDRLLTENLVFIDFYDTSANNAVIECIARGTPIVVCRHPAVEEYLLPDYPLYYDDYAEIGAMLRDEGRLRAAAAHLTRDDLRRRLSLEHFADTFSSSDVIRHAL